MIENDHKFYFGEIVWIIFSDKIIGVEVKEVDFGQMRLTLKSEFSGRIFRSFHYCFSSKEALLQHLSDTAVPLPTEGENKA